MPTLAVGFTRWSNSAHSIGLWSPSCWWTPSPWSVTIMGSPDDRPIHKASQTCATRKFVMYQEEHKTKVVKHWPSRSRDTPGKKALQMSHLIACLSFKKSPIECSSVCSRLKIYSLGVTSSFVSNFNRFDHWIRADLPGSDAPTGHLCASLCSSLACVQSDTLLDSLAESRCVVAQLNEIDHLAAVTAVSVHRHFRSLGYANVRRQIRSHLRNGRETEK